MVEFTVLCYLYVKASNEMEAYASTLARSLTCPHNALKKFAIPSIFDLLCCIMCIVYVYAVSFSFSSSLRMAMAIQASDTETI